jgi:hypothetical protein
MAVDKLTIRIDSELLKEIKHYATDNNTTVTKIIHDAISQFFHSKKVSTYEGDDLAVYVRLLVPLFVKILRKFTQNDETVNANFNELYVDACRKVGSPSRIGALDEGNLTLKNRVYQELLGKGFIKETTNGNIVITYLGKSAPGLG